MYVLSKFVELFLYSSIIFVRLYVRKSCIISIMICLAVRDLFLSGVCILSRFAALFLYFSDFIRPYLKLVLAVFI